MSIYGQSTDGNALLSNIVERIDVLFKSPENIHPSIPYYGLKKLQNGYSLEMFQGLSKKDSFDIQYLISESALFSDSASYSKLSDCSKGLWGFIYSCKHHMVDINKPNFKFWIDPILHFSLGDDMRDDNLIFQNSRGIKFRGLIDSKVYFYTSIIENQRRFLQHIEQNIEARNAIPGQGFFRPYQSRIFGKLNGWDYLNAQAFIQFEISKSISVELGHGNNFIGNGYHSLLLSNYAHNYFYLKLNTVFWKVHYQNIFAELSANSSADNQGDRLLPKKYMAAHYLTFKLSENINLGFYEAVIFGRQGNFELQYLNPVILYRSAELFLDSPDNVLFGLNFSWNILNKMQIYSQVIIDELRFSEVFKNRGWWGNKYGWQMGIKVYDILQIDHLDGLIERNTVRPYTYAHRVTQENPELVIASYSHFNQPLAHPLGANFEEWIVQLSYRPANQSSYRMGFIFSRTGTDEDGNNWGSDILKDYNTRTQDFNNAIGQGDNTNVYLLSLGASQSIFYNYFIDFNYVLRAQKRGAASNKITSHYFGVGLRANIDPQRLVY